MTVTTYFVMYPLLAFTLVVFGVVIYAMVSTSIKSGEDGKPRRNGIETMGQIVAIKSMPGENSGFINVVITAKYLNRKSGKEYEGEAKAVIDATRVTDYQPGKEIKLIYNTAKPEKIFLQIPNPLLARKKS